MLLPGDRFSVDRDFIFSGEVRPASDYHVAVLRIQFNADALSAGHLGCDQSRSGTEERIVDRLTRRGVVFDRTFHALHWFLSAMSGFVFSGFVYVPDSALLSVTNILSSLAFLDSIPTRLMLPMIVTSTKKK